MDDGFIWFIAFSMVQKIIPVLTQVIATYPAKRV